MYRKLIAVSASAMLLAAPAIALAQGTATGQSIEGLAGRLTTILLGTIVPILFVVGTVMLIWGVIKYLVLGSDNEEQRKSGQQMITWGIIGLFLAGAIGGLLVILQNSFRDTIPEQTQIRLDLPEFQRR